MAWARLDDSFHDHPKVDGLSLASVGLYTLCLTWAHRHRRDAATPGFIPESRVTKLAGGRQSALVRELTAAPPGKKHGMWEPVEGGFLIHDFADYLPKERDPENRKEAGRKGARKRWEGHSKPDGKLPSTSMASDSSRASAPASPSRTDPPTVALPDPNPTRPVPTTSGANSTAPDIGALVADFVDHCRERPPGPFIARLGREVKALVADGTTQDAIRGGLVIVAERGLQPTALPGAVHEHQNARPRTSPPKASTTDQRVGAAFALGNELRSEGLG